MCKNYCVPKKLENYKDEDTAGSLIRLKPAEQQTQQHHNCEMKKIFVVWLWLGDVWIVSKNLLNFVQSIIDLLHKIMYQNINSISITDFQTKQQACV